MIKPDLINIYLQIQHYIWNVLEENSNLSRLTTTVKTQGIISNQQNQRKGNTHTHTHSTATTNNNNASITTTTTQNNNTKITGNSNH